MINHNYLIDTDNIKFSSSGGQCDCLPIKDHPELSFKCFKKKSKAQEAHRLQKKLCKLELAPKIYSNLCKIAYYYDPKILEYWTPKQTTTSWGYITETAISLDIDGKIPYKKIQDLVNNIWLRTNMKFWDCHAGNVGYIRRNKKKVLVCIDTGWESFDEQSNQWGNRLPGPVCPDCKICLCNCYDKE